MWTPRDFNDEQIAELTKTLRTKKQTKIMMFFINNENTEKRIAKFIHGNNTIEYKTIAKEIGVVPHTVRRIHKIIESVLNKEENIFEEEHTERSRYQEKLREDPSVDFIEEYKSIRKQIEDSLDITIQAFIKGKRLEESLTHSISVEEGISRDLLHYIEFNNLSDSESLDIYKMMQQSRIKRRSIINSLTAIKNLTSESVIGQIFIDDAEIVLESVKKYIPHYENYRDGGCTYAYNFIDFEQG